MEVSQRRRWIWAEPHIPEQYDLFRDGVELRRSGFGTGTRRQRLIPRITGHGKRARTLATQRQKTMAFVWRRQEEQMTNASRTERSQSHRKTYVCPRWRSGIPGYAGNYTSSSITTHSVWPEALAYARAI